MAKTFKKNKKGSILVFAILILTIITVTALGLANVTRMEIKSSLDTKDSATAFQNAESGMEKMLLEILKTSNDLDTLNTLATKLGGSCDNTNGIISVPGKDVEYSFKKSIVVGNSEVSKDVNNCSTVLADIEKVKIVGKHDGITRAFYQKLKTSLKRDLVAHWKFEDNVDALVKFINFPGSPTAKDYSNNDHTLTLCPIDNGDHKLANNGGSGDESFDYCHQYVGGDPTVLGDVNNDDNLDDSIWMAHGGAFKDATNGMLDNYGTAWGEQGHKLGYIETSGIVYEYNGDKALGGALSSMKGQALYFNGRSNYLTMNTSDNNRPNYVKNENDLVFSDKISISFWVKFEGDLSDNIDALILSKYSATGHKGYKVYIKDSTGEICAVLGNKEKCDSDMSDNKWHHVVITWDRAISSDIDMYVDNTKQNPSVAKSSALSSSSNKFMIGGNYTRNDKNEPYLPTPYVFPHADIEEPFEGYLDDIRLYNRKLSESEVNRLCIMGDKTNADWSGC